MRPSRAGRCTPSIAAVSAATRVQQPQSRLVGHGVEQEYAGERGERDLPAEDE
ncbi:MAG TPA: hypothetical protein VGJ53_21040 [Micromonosporaceae bacterium]